MLRASQKVNETHLVNACVRLSQSTTCLKQKILGAGDTGALPPTVLLNPPRVGALGMREPTLFSLSLDPKG